MRVLFYGTPAFALPTLPGAARPPSRDGRRDAAGPAGRPRAAGAGLAGEGAGPGARDPRAPAGPAPRPGLARAPRRARGRRRGRRGVRPDPSAGGPRRARARVDQRARVAAPAVSRRGPDRVGHHPRRARDRDHDLPDGSRGWTPGPVLLQRPTPIGPEETAGELAGRLAALGAEVLLETLARLDTLVPRPQDSRCGDPGAAAPQGGRRPRLDGAGRDPRGARPGTESLARGRHRGAGRPPADLARARPSRAGASRGC